jgi:HAD superfamily hydrolase (TIGR01509 family)
VQRRFREAFRRARPVGAPRYVGDGRPFWRGIVAFSLGVDDPALFEELYLTYAEPAAWTLAEGARPALAALRAAGVRVAVASNWDNRLRPLLGGLGVEVDALAISSELAVEKPDPAFFLLAAELLGVPPSHALHVGDDPVDDVGGARAAGIRAWLWGEEVRTMAELGARLGAPLPDAGGPG